MTSVASSNAPAGTTRACAPSAATGSTLSAHAPVFTMVPSSVRRRATAVNGRADAANGGVHAQGGEGGRKPRARRQRKKKDANATARSSGSPVAQTRTGADAEDEEKPPAPRQKKKKKPARSKATTVAEPDQQAATEDEKDYCLLCADAIKFYAVGECNHQGICSKCSMRMRLLMDDRSCPMCKQPMDRVVVSSSKRDFESFELWGDAAGPDSVLDEPSDMIFVGCRSHYTALRSLREFQCRLKRCREVFGSLGKLKEHLHREHNVEFCELCLAHQTFFIQEQEVFSKGTLKSHNIGRTRGGLANQKHANTGKDFHPACQFCRKRFYGDKELYEHLERDHFKCHMCKIENEYFRNYASLETHFRRDHHLCENPRCLSMRFVVFPNDVEYQAHMSSIHGVHNRLQFNFQVARGGENPIGGPGGPAYADDVPDRWNVESRGREPTPAPTLESVFPALPAPAGPAPPVVTAPAIARPPSVRSYGAPPVHRLPGPPRAQAVRNQRLAQALGVSRPGHAGGDTAAFEEELETPSYPQHLVDWGKANASYLLVVERRLERIVKESNCHSVSLRPMPAEERALMHELASFYGVASESFGEDPNRRLSFFKKEDAFVPSVTLSMHIARVKRQAREAQAASRLKFLPLRSATPGPAPAPAQTPAAPAFRGWEHIEPRRAPVVPDAWSDEEENEASGEAQDKSDADADADADAEEKSAVRPQTVAVEHEGGEHKVQDEGGQTPASLEERVAAIKIDEEDWD